MDTELIYDVYETLESRYRNEPCFETGFFDLDDLLSLREKGVLITIGARPAMGKTSFMYNIMQNVAKQGKTCLLFSLEMSKEQAAQRLLASEAEVDTQRLRLGNMQASDWEKLADAMNKLIEMPILIEDKPTLTVEEMEEKIKGLKPDVVFIDYLQLVGAPKKLDRCNQIEHIMRELKRISVENEVIIFISSQLSRAVEQRVEKRPMLSDLRESSSIETISDIIMFIYRAEYYSHQLDEEYAVLCRGEAEIIVAKNRFGPSGVVLLKFASHITKFLNPIKIKEWF